MTVREQDPFCVWNCINKRCLNYEAVILLKLQRRVGTNINHQTVVCVCARNPSGKVLPLFVGVTSGVHLLLAAVPVLVWPAGMLAFPCQCCTVCWSLAVLNTKKLHLKTLGFCSRLSFLKPEITSQGQGGRNSQTNYTDFKENWSLRSHIIARQQFRTLTYWQVLLSTTHYFLRSHFRFSWLQRPPQLLKPQGWGADAHSPTVPCAGGVCLEILIRWPAPLNHSEMSGNYFFSIKLFKLQKQ